MSNEKRIVVSLEYDCGVHSYGYSWKVLDEHGSVIEEGSSDSVAKSFMDAYCFCDSIDLIRG